MQHIGHVGHREELLHIRKAVCLGQTVRVFRVNLGLTRQLTGHLQVADQLFLTTSTLGNLDDFLKVRWVLCANVRVHRIFDTQSIELSFTKT